MTKYWYLSFASENGFLGACIVGAIGPKHALKVANQHGLNQGGEVMILPVPAEKTATIRKNLYKLLRTGKEVALAFGDAADGIKKYSQLTPKQQEFIDSIGTEVCEKHNKASSRKH